MDDLCARHDGLPGDAQVQCAVSLLAAMAHPTRLAVLLGLSRLGPQAAGALGELLGIEQSSMSHQLRVLRDAHLVIATRQGRQMIYALADDHVAHIVEDALTHGAELPPRGP
jgi:DNA-binding transcriptional ArsR family regulator